MHLILTKVLGSSFKNVCLDFSEEVTGQIYMQNLKRLKKHQPDRHPVSLSSPECSPSAGKSSTCVGNSSDYKEGQKYPRRDECSRGGAIPSQVKNRKLGNEESRNINREQLKKNYRLKHEPGRSITEAAGEKRLKVRGPSILGLTGGRMD